MKNSKQKGFTSAPLSKKSGAGFTFLEAMIAIAVLLTGIVAILQVFPLAFSIERSNQMKTKAAMLVQEKIEEVNSQAYQNISIGNEIEDPLPSPFEKFSRETTISYVDSELQDSVNDVGLKKIEIIISWESFLKLGENSLEVVSLATEM